jgi:hypothetical protein
MHNRRLEFFDNADNIIEYIFYKFFFARFWKCPSPVGTDVRVYELHSEAIC